MKSYLNDLILHFDGEIYNLCYKVINESKQLKDDFQYLCEHLVKLPQEKTIVIDTYLSGDEYDFIRKIYDARIEGILSEVINKVNYGVLEQDEFYSELYRKLIDSFKNKKELAVAFERVLSDSRIPFVYLGKPLTMSQKDYKNYIEKNESNIKKLIYILKTDYSQKTEEASILLNFLESIENYDDRVVVLAQMIDILKRGGMASVLKDLIIRVQEDGDKE